MRSFQLQRSFSWRVSAAAGHNNNGRRSTTAQRQRQRRTRRVVYCWLQWIAIGCLVSVYLSVFQYLEDDIMSYERVVQINKEGETKAKEMDEQRKEAKLQREKDREERIKNGEVQDQQDVSFWRILLFYFLLRFWFRSRLGDDDDDDDDIDQHNSGGGGFRGIMWSLSPQQQRASRFGGDGGAAATRFRVWAERLNQQRVQRGQPPLSIETLQGVLRERDNGQDYEALLRYNEEATATDHHGTNNHHRSVPQEQIDRLVPARTLQASDQMLIQQQDNSTAAASAAAQEFAQTHCSICLEEFVVQETVRSLPCQHTFHSTCIDRWLASVSSCPVCKQSILDS